MITEQAAMEIAKKARLYMTSDERIKAVTRALNLAHADGQRSMRERAAKVSRHYHYDADAIGKAILNLEIE